jgi:outer membrane protein assembly factor BamB
MNFYCITKDGREIWRFKTDGPVFWCAATWNDKIYFSSWDCHVYCLTLDGKKLWAFATSTLQQSYVPDFHEGWEAEIKKSAVSDEHDAGEKYSSKSNHQREFESEYAVKSQYVTKSEYG